MRRKFLYFKIYDLKEHPLEIETLSLLEIESLIGKVEPVDNVFQLSKQPEVKRVLEKDVNLQNALTDSLPRRGRHGYLWIGDTLPDVARALSRLSYIKEIFLFQQLLEPEPDFIKQNLKNLTFMEFDVNLWRVYKFLSFSYFLNRTLSIGTIGKTEGEIDTYFNTFREELKLTPEKIADKDPGQLLSFIQEDLKVKNLNLDQRNPNETLLNNRWLRALINTLTFTNNATLLNPFCGDGVILLEGALAGVNFDALDINPIETIIAQANSFLTSIDSTELSRLTIEIHSKIQMLMSASAATQTDLFLYSTEGQFLSFWETEEKRFKTLGLNAQLEYIQKQIAATRFLIQTEAITNSVELNALFNAALINVIALALRKKEKIDFTEVFSKMLHSIYLKVYLLNKLRKFYTIFDTKVSVSNHSFLEQTPAADRYDGIIAFLPSRINRNGLEKDRLIIEMLNLHANPVHLEKAIIGAKQIKPEQREALQTEITDQSGFFKQLPKEGKDILTRMELMGNQEDVIRYYLLWKQYFESFKSFSSAAKAGSKICLIIENPVLKIDKSIINIRSSKILENCIENNGGLFVKKLITFSKGIPHTKLIYKREVSVLLYEKNAS
jgi:hypothetical protein